MELRLAGAVVRSWRPGDDQSLALHGNNREVWINLRDAFPHPYTVHDARLWIEWASGHRPETHFALEVEGAAAGGIGFVIQPDVHCCSAEIGFWLGQPFWGRGIMTQAVKAVTAHALREHGLRRVYAQVFAWNPASVRVLEKAGYVREGVLRSSAVKDGKVTDQVVLAVTQ
ncbi:MAG TPA: GNAT family N-acetyltransferase [Gemmatimonadales bacterium]|nr:GNAT family N-acetyltransferase [Gemmatimonadales bacterium]